jgi:hypothetical protein
MVVITRTVIYEHIGTTDNPRIRTIIQYKTNVECRITLPSQLQDSQTEVVLVPHHTLTLKLSGDIKVQADTETTIHILLSGVGDINSPSQYNTLSYVIVGGGGGGATKTSSSSRGGGGGGGHGTLVTGTITDSVIKVIKYQVGIGGVSDCAGQSSTIRMTDTDILVEANGGYAGHMGQERNSGDGGDGGLYGGGGGGEYITGCSVGHGAAADEDTTAGADGTEAGGGLMSPSGNGGLGGTGYKSSFCSKFSGVGGSGGSGGIGVGYTAGQNGGGGGGGGCGGVGAKDLTIKGGDSSGKGGSGYGAGGGGGGGIGDNISGGKGMDGIVVLKFVYTA